MGKKEDAQMKVEEDYFDRAQGYEARGIVARIQPIGHYQASVLLRLPIYQYLTLDCGEGRKAMAVQFVGTAPYNEVNGERFLDATKLKPGHIVVDPGFVYKKITMTGQIMAEHLKALKRYRRKDIIKAERDASGGSIDLGMIDLTSDKVALEAQKKGKILH